MVDIPLNPYCPNCQTEGLDNLNMIINITTEQPLSFFKKMPTNISLNRKDAHNSAWINWDSKASSIICKSCGYSSSDPNLFEKKINKKKKKH